MGRKGIAGCILALCTSQAGAAGLTVVVRDAGGKPVADAVVMLRPVSGQRPPAAPRPARLIVDQRNLVFTPYLQVARPGDDVVFRNSDGTRHHVYSFSPARTFEFVLAPEQASPPRALERGGAIAVGCNIHDRMIAYLYVTDAPWWVQTGPGGKAMLADLPGGDYELQVWQPRLRPGKPLPRQRISLAEGAGAQAVSVTLQLLPDPRQLAGRERVDY